MNFSTFIADLDGFIFREISPREGAELEDEMDTKYGRGKAVSLYETTKKRFITALTSWPLKDENGAAIECNENNKGEFFDFNESFCISKLIEYKHALAKEREEARKKLNIGRRGGTPSR